MKRISIIIAAIACLAACEKPVDTSLIVGTWNECYDDPDFIMDGSVEYTFKADGTYQVYSCVFVTSLPDNASYAYT